MSLKIAFVADFENESLLLWNTTDTAESLRGGGVDCVSLRIPQDQDKLFDYDVVIFYRSLQYNWKPLIQALQSKYIEVGFFIDDLIFDPRFPPYYDPSFELHTREMFASADFYMFTSEFLSQFAPPGRPIFIRRPGMLERRFNAVKFGDSHSEFRLMLCKGEIGGQFKETLDSIFQKCQPSKPVQVIFFSYQELVFPSAHKNFSFVRYTPCRYESYLKTIAYLNPDLILNPLVNDDFHNSKCYPKYLEAGAIRSCLLASDIVPYKKCIQEGVTGLLAGSVDEFVKKIEWGVEHRQELKTLGKNAWADVRDNHLLGPIAQKFYKELCAAYEG